MGALASKIFPSPAVPEGDAVDAGEEGDMKLDLLSGVDGEDGEEKAEETEAEKAKRLKAEEKERKKNEKKTRGGGFFGSTVALEYIDPPMPDVGLKVDFDKLLTRKLNVKKATRMMYNVINKDTSAAVADAKAIPVTDMIERVKVTDPIIDLIGLRTSKLHDRQYVKDNLLLSQKYLSLRRSTLNMMNHNYMDLIVMKLDTVQVKEARTKVSLHAESHLQEGSDEEWDDEDYSVSIKTSPKK